MNILTKQINIKIPQSYKSILIYILLITFAFAIRFFLFSISDNYWGADPDERIRVCSNWLELGAHRPLFISDLWLPLHLYLLALVIKLSHNLAVAPRLIHILIGCISVIPFYLLIKLIFGRKFAFYSSLFFIFFPLHVLCSIVTLSEILFLLVFIMFLYLFFCYLETERGVFFWSCVLFFILSSMLRYEAWIFLPTIFLLLIFKGKYKKAVIYLISASVFPFFWITFVRRPLHYAHYYFLLYRKLISDLTIDNAVGFHWVSVLVRYFSLPLLLMSLLGIIFSLKDRKKILFLMVPMLLFLLFTYYIPTKNDEFALLFAVCLIPFMASALLRFIDNIKFFKQAIMTLITGIILILFINTSLNLVQIYPDFISTLAQYLRYNLTSKDKVLLYNYSCQLNHIPVIVGFPTMRFTIADYGGDMLIRQEHVDKFVRKNRPKYIIYTDRSNLSLSSNIRMSLKMIMEAGDYTLYEAIYN